jgi:type IV pilus assembly protein PilY1
MNIVRNRSFRPLFQGASRHWWALPAAFMATVLALPVNAGIEIPTDPLTSEKRLPPNIVFILDDSSSMGMVAMPASVRELNDGNARYISGKDGLADNPTDRSYVINTIYYDPAEGYDPWIKPDGSRYTGGMTVDKVFANLDDPIATGNSVGACGTTAVNPNNEVFCSLVGSVNSIFYVPNTAKGYTAGSTNAAQYDRYNIRTVNGVTQVGIGDGTSNSGNWNDRDIPASTMVNVAPINVAADSGPLTVTATSGTGGNADLYVRFGSYPTASLYDGISATAGNSESVTIDKPAAGTWYIGVRNAHASIKVTKEDIAATVLKFRAQTLAFFREHRVLRKGTRAVRTHVQ